MKPDPQRPASNESVDREYITVDQTKETRPEPLVYNSKNETTFIEYSFNLTRGEFNSLNRTRTVIVYDKIAFVAFVAFVVFDVFGLPAIAICSASLFTKIISFEAQGFGQGNFES